MNLALLLAAAGALPAPVKRRRYLVHPDDWAKLRDRAREISAHTGADLLAALDRVEFVVSPLAERGVVKPLPEGV